MKIYIGTEREIGRRCKAWASENLSSGVELVEDPEECEIFISVLYPRLLKPEFIEGRFCFNFHPGILPEYRGAGACSWAIVNGDLLGGVTLHVIDEGVDTGPIIDIIKFPLEERDTAESVFRKTEDTIFEMFKAWLHLIVHDTRFTVYRAYAQPAGGHTYSHKDLEQTKDLTRFVRALTFNGKESAYYTNAAGEKIYLDFYDSASE